MSGTPETYQSDVADGVHIEQVLWRQVESKVEVELVAIHGGGHVIPQPYCRAPRFSRPDA